MDKLSTGRASCDSAARASAWRRPKVNLLLLALMLLAGCVAPRTQTSIPVTVPARSAEAARLKRVAVLPFESKRGVDITAEVESSLAGVMVEGRPFFTVVERQRINDLLRELKRQESGLIDPQTALKLGKMLGAKGVYTGSVTRADTDDSHYSEARQRCAYWETRYDKKGNSYQGRCLRVEQYSVDCTKRVGAFSFAPKLVDVESGRIIYATELKGHAQAAICSDSQKPLPSTQELFDQAKHDALAQFVRDVAPSDVTMRITILEDAEQIRSDAGKQSFTRAVLFAKAGRMDRACETWRQLLTTEEQSFSIAYDVGVCDESQGNLVHALEMYNRADRMLNAPNTAVSNAIVRVKQTVANEQKLKAQLDLPAQNALRPVSVAPSGQIEHMSAIELQKRLLALGYKVGKPDGIMGPRTIDALKSFQRDNKLPVTGETDDRTIEALRQ